MSPTNFEAQATTADLLLARRDDDATALLFEDRTWNWREYVAECAVRAQALTALRHRDTSETPWHVGVLMENSPEYLFLIGGAALAGATIVGINPTRRGAELRSDIARTDTRVVLVDDAHVALTADFADDLPVVGVTSSDYRALLESAADASADDWDRRLDNHLLLLLFTSGSTGAPKAVKCSSARLAALGARNLHAMTSDDIVYNAMPLFHGNALMSAWAPIASVGGAFALRNKFSASGFLPDIQKFQATFFNYVGRSLAYILAQPEQPAEADNNLRLAWGTEASVRDREEFTRRFGTPVIESYGSSEGVCVIVCRPNTPRGALGKPDPRFDMIIVDPQGREVPTAQIGDDGSLRNGAEAIGEIIARGGAARFEGYYNNPEADADKIRNGDYWSGDLAYRDADGVFWFAGRTNDWIRVDSENFSTAPLERIVGRYPGVAGVAAYAVPDPQTGDRVMVSLEYDGRFDADDFRQFLRAQPDMGTKWTPNFVRLVENFPLTATRKVDKAPLRRTGWRTADPVYALSDDAYRLLDDAATAQLTVDFRAHDRAHLLPT